MTEDNGAGFRGDEFRDEEINLTRALGAKRPVLVDAAFVGDALRAWVGDDERRSRLLRAMYLAHVRPVADNTPLLERDGAHELASDLASFLLARLPSLEFEEEPGPDGAERRGRMWGALTSLAGACPRLFLLEEPGPQVELEIEVELEEETPVGASQPLDVPQYGEAEFWAATERPRLRRAARASLEDHDCGHLARERDLAILLGGSGGQDDTCVPGVTPIVETSEDGSELAYLPLRELRIPRELRRRHVLVVGPTGTGKTTRAVLPLLRGDIANPGLSVVVVDTKGELLPAVRSFVEAYRPGEEVHLVNFRDPDRSLGWNPLARVRTHADALELSHNLCHAVEHGRGASDSLFWLNNSIDLLAAMFLALKQERGRRASIADALQLADLPVQEFDRFARRHPDLEVLGRFASYVSSGSHNAETILADLRMRLVLWRDERVRAVTSTDELDFTELAKKPSVVVLQVPEEDVEELKPVTNAWLDQLLAAELAVARESPGLVLPVQLSLYLEEFASSVGRIPKFERRLNTCRQPGISVTASVQSLWQIEHEYGSAFRSILAGFSTKVLFADGLIEDAQWFSASAGDTTVLESAVSLHDEGPVESPYARRISPRRTRTERASQRPLLSAAQLQRPPANEMLGRAVTWFAPGLPPFQAFLTPIYQLERGARLMDRARALGGPGERREEPLVHLPAARRSGSGARAGGSPPSAGLSNTRGWTEEELRARLDEVLVSLDLEGAYDAASTWWRRFERENKKRLGLVLRLAEELANRQATVAEFFQAYVYSNTDNIQANLHYLDYRRLKHKEEQQRAKQASSVAPKPSAPDKPEGDSRGRARERELRRWLERVRSSGMTYADAASASGFTVSTLRYWRKKWDL